MVEATRAAPRTKEMKQAQEYKDRLERIATAAMQGILANASITNEVAAEYDDTAVPIAAVSVLMATTLIAELENEESD